MKAADALKLAVELAKLVASIVRPKPGPKVDPIPEPHKKH